MTLNFEKIFADHKPLYIHGETGTGKSTLVHQLCREHLNVKPVVVNLACLSESLFESQLFGHKKGAFTGADKDSEGFLGRAQSGVIFLDEVSEISLSSQRKLLSLLEEKTYYPVGSNQLKRFRGQIITAGQPGLRQKVEKGEFRQDLYYRLCRFELYLKPLREQNKIILSHLNKYRLKVSTDLYHRLLNDYRWPGNFRELANFIDFLEYTSVTRQIGTLDCPSWMQLEKQKTQVLEGAEFSQETYSQAYEEFEKNFLSKAMYFYSGRVNFASQQLEMSKSTLIAKLKKYGISSLKIRAMSQEGALKAC